MALIFLSIGSNLGDRISYLESALQAIKKNLGPLLSKSAVYESQSWGYEGQHFLNMVVSIESHLKPTEIINLLKEIESRTGRIKIPGRYTDRPIDLDILFYNSDIFETKELIIPHPHLQNRLFVLVPMMDIDPEFVHPVFGLTIRQLKDVCSDKGWIQKYGEIK